MDLNHKRVGSGPPLLLIHGLAGNRNSFDPIIDALAAHREVIAIDLPGCGQSPPLPQGTATIPAFADAVTSFLKDNDLLGVDVVGSSLGARLSLELARRGGVVGKVVALDPGGFWKPGAQRFFSISVGASIRLVNALRPILPFLAGNPVTRTLLLPQFTARPWAIPKDVVLPALLGFKDPATRPAFKFLAKGPQQEGLAKGAQEHPIVLVWGKRDFVTPASQAKLAQERFPDATLELIGRCGHFPHWDQPDAAVRIILGHTG
jgi:pimeloyl-ACP methyl ester carboxylesterase